MPAPLAVTTFPVHHQHQQQQPVLVDPGLLQQYSGNSFSHTGKGTPVVLKVMSDTLESFLSKVAFESNLRKKLAKTEHVLIVKVSFERSAGFLSKVTFESDFQKKTF